MSEPKLNLPWRKVETAAHDYRSNYTGVVFAVFDAKDRMVLANNSPIHDEIDRAILCVNACRGLARVDKIPLLIQNCESLLPLIQESHPTYYVSLKATIAQIKGAE